MGLDRVGPVEPLARAGAAGDGLVVLDPVVAEGEVVHGAGPLGLYAQGRVQGAGDGLGGLHVPRDGRRRVDGSQHRSFRDADVQGLQAAAVERDVLLDQGPEHVEDGGRDHGPGGVEVAALLGRGPLEVDDGAARFAVHVHPHRDDRPVVGLVAAGAVAQPGHDPAYGLLGVVLDVAHVGLDDVLAELPGHAAQFRDALLVGRDLGAQVGEVGVGVAGGVGGAGEQAPGLGLAERAVAHEEPVVEQDALLVDGAAEGGHGTGGDAADLRVVAARGHQEAQPGPLPVRGLVEHRADDGHVGQVRPAVVRVVDGVDVAGPQGARVAPEHLLDGLPHRPEVHRDVRGVGHQAAVRVEQGAGEVQALLDVDGVGGVLQSYAHLLGDRHEEVVEHFEHDGVHPGPDGRPARSRFGPAQHEVPGRPGRGLPAGVDDGGGVVLGDDGGPPHDVLRAQCVAAVQRGVPPSVPGEHPDGAEGPRRPLPGTHSGPGRGVRAGGSGGLHGDGLGHQGFVHGEAVPRPVCLGELPCHGRDGAVGDGQGGVCPGVPQEDPCPGGDGAVGDAVGTELRARPLRQVVADRADAPRRVLVQGRLDGLFAHRGGVGEADPVRGQDAGQRRYEDGADAQGVGDGAGVLSSGAAEGGEGVAGDVVAALYGDLLDRVRHVQHGDLQEPGGHLGGRVSAPRGGRHLLGQGVEALTDETRVEWLVAPGPEDGGEVLGADAAEHHVGVGDGERPAPAVAGGARVGPGRVGADPVAPSVEVQDGPSAGRDGVDTHHGRAHPHPCHLGAEFAFELARVVGDVGGGAAHVEADDPVVAGLGGRAHHADHAARGTGEHGVLAPEVRGLAQPAVGLHEHEPDPREFGGHFLDVPTQDR